VVVLAKRDAQNQTIAHAIMLLYATCAPRPRRAGIPPKERREGPARPLEILTWRETVFI
jgi:hypothetical protein